VKRGVEAVEATTLVLARPASSAFG
jgi:hypothetical protein